MTTQVRVIAGHKGCEVSQNEELNFGEEKSHGYSHSSTTFNLDAGESRDFVVTDTRSIHVREPDHVFAGASQPITPLNGEAFDKARAELRSIVRDLGDNAQNRDEHERLNAVLVLLDQQAGVE